MEEMNMNYEQLTLWVQEVSTTYFKKPFRHQAVFKKPYRHFDKTLNSNLYQSQFRVPHQTRLTGVRVVYPSGLAPA